VRIAGLLAALLALAGCARTTTPAPPPVEIDTGEADAHSLTDHGSVRDAAQSGSLGTIPVRVVVAPDGRVTDARLEIYHSTDPRPPRRVIAKAAQEARRWRYRPFIRNGEAIAVTFVETVALYPPEDRPLGHVPMPPFDATARITLERTPCFGTCPSYTVEISADGTVVFNGRDYVFVRGVHRRRIDPAAVRHLFALARDADFFSLRDFYAASMTDNPSYLVTIEAGGRRKRISDYVGEAVGMPSSIKALQDAIDAAAGTRRWIEGDESTVPALIAEHYDLSGFEGARMLASAALAGEARIVGQLIRAGSPLRSAPPSGGLQDPISALTAAARGGDSEIVTVLLSRRDDWSLAELREAIEAANAGGSYEAFALLARRGALAGISEARTTQLLLHAAETGNPRLVAAILSRHIDVNRVDPNYPTGPALNAASGVTCRWDQSPRTCDPAMVVALLLHAGANPRVVNRISPESPLSLVSDPRIALLLLRAGADPNFPDPDGEPPLFSIYNEDVAMIMLDAGANPRAHRPGDNMSLVGWARYQQWTRVLARLRHQGIAR
jgi:ankyrin repeat protein